MLTEYTSYDEVRAVLGVSTDELDDSTLALPLYETLLVFDLEDVDTRIPDAFKAISLLAYAARTTAEKRLYEVTRLFSAYVVANQLLTSLPYFGEIRMQDGRAAKQRIADPYTLVLQGVQAGIQDLRLRLSAAYSAVNTSAAVVTATARVTAVGTGLAKDPVTNV